MALRTGRSAGGLREPDVADFSPTQALRAISVGDGSSDRVAEQLPLNLVLGLVLGAGSLVGGFLAEGGRLGVLWQPFEFLIIGGIAIGVFVMGNPFSTISDTVKGVVEAATNRVPKRTDFLSLLSLMFALMRDLRTRPRNEVEAHIDNPQELAAIPAFPAYPQRQAANPVHLRLRSPDHHR